MLAHPIRPSWQDLHPVRNMTSDLMEQRYNISSCFYYQALTEEVKVIRLCLDIQDEVNVAAPFARLTEEEMPTSLGSSRSTLSVVNVSPRGICILYNLFIVEREWIQGIDELRKSFHAQVL